MGNDSGGSVVAVAGGDGLVTVDDIRAAIGAHALEKRNGLATREGGEAE